MKQMIIRRLCDGDKRRTLISRIFGKLITVRRMQKWQ